MLGELDGPDVGGLVDLVPSQPQQLAASGTRPPLQLDQAPDRRRYVALDRPDVGFRDALDVGLALVRQAGQRPQRREPVGVEQLVGDANFPC